MYHGNVIPGFPAHPHRGFETVTIVRRGFIDHADSLGATARFGSGDVQWLTTGAGIVHSEMFPLRDRERSNPLELFQIWLNLPAANKLVAPHFTMLWRETLPTCRERDASGLAIDIELFAGRLGERQAPPPPPASWAARPDADVAIWLLRMAAGARWTLPGTTPGVLRSLYFFRGSRLQLGGREIRQRSAIRLRAGRDALLVNGPDESELLLLQGRPIGEPVAQQGPFVMTSPAELRQAFLDYQRTGFGGWPWPEPGPVHPREESRFARYPDGRIERPPAATGGLDRP
jgi:hypothetical protein